MIVLSALLLFVVAAYLILAEKVFREDKELLVFDTNRTGTQQLAGELEGSLRRFSDKLEILAQLAAQPSRESRALASDFFEEDPDLLLFQLVREGRVSAELVSKRKLAAANLSEERVRKPDILDGPEGSPAAPTKIRGGIYMDNRSIPDAPLFLVRVPVRFRPALRSEAFVQAIYDGRNWLERFRQHQGLAFSFAVNPQGRLLAYPRVEPVLERKDMSQLEPIRQAMQQDFSVQQIEFNMEGKRYLGLYQKTSLGSLIVISMTDKAAALAARGLLLEKTLYLSLFIFTIVFLISLLFASSLSTPLLRLVKATREIALGNFDTEIAVDGGDEIGTLARSFTQMGRELKSSRLLLEQYNAELETKVQNRTEELEKKNADIRKQQEVLLHATRLAAVGEIAGQAAHEVLNPLTAMISRLESVASRVHEFNSTQASPLPALRTILRDWEKEYRAGGTPGLAKALEQPSQVIPGKKMADEDLENLDWITSQFEALAQKLGTDLELLLKESHRIGRIVDGMRGLSRASKIKTRTDLAALIAECVRVNEDLLKRHKIWIETRFDENPIHVQIDQDEMRQVFSNLIKNALDAINPVIQDRQLGLILIHAFVDKEHQVRVRVRDNGTGIPEESRQRLFEADFSTKGVHGTGFGLSICRRFVREAGGELTLLESVPGSHTEFEITLPLAEPETVG